MSQQAKVIVALSGGVDSAVAALLLQRSGHAVECLHMTNWEDEDGYCEAAADYQDARRVTEQLGLPLHRVNFSREYSDRVFEDFLDEHRAGRTPNPDVLCNREIKFGVLRQYVRRLGADQLATGHYARLAPGAGGPSLLKGVDPAKDQSYFLHAVHGRDLNNVLFPLGNYYKRDVRTLAVNAGLGVSAKKDSTGICFVGERPFADFLGRYLPNTPGAIITPQGKRIGEHQGLAFYTLGQRQGLNVGGMRGLSGEPWYVAQKRFETNELVAVQGRNHRLLYQNWLAATAINWISKPPIEWRASMPLRCSAKTRYRQPDRPCTLLRSGDDKLELTFDAPEWSITPGQYAVFYQGDRCLGGARIERAEMRETVQTVQAG